MTRRVVMVALAGASVVLPCTSRAWAADPASPRQALAASIVRHLDEGPVGHTDRVALVAELLQRAEATSATDARTEVERLQVEALTLTAQLARAIADADACRVELAPTRTRLNALALQAQGDKLAAAIEAAHPGMRVNRSTWLLEAAPVTPSAPGPHP